LGIAPGAKRPGAKKTETAAPAPEAAPAAESGNGATEAPAAPGPDVKGLGIARGARPPGKRS
jgi:hypothetical protein